MLRPEVIHPTEASAGVLKKTCYDQLGGRLWDWSKRSERILQKDLTTYGLLALVACVGQISVRFAF